MRNDSPVSRPAHQLLLAPPPTFAEMLADPATWTLKIMTSAICDAERQRFREALAVFVAERDLQAHFSSGTTCIAPTAAAITAEDRGAVIGWLCARPEVHFVHVHRRPPHTRSLVLACAPDRAAERGSPAWTDNRHGPDEDLSQDLEWTADKEQP